MIDVSAACFQIRWLLKYINNARILSIYLGSSFVCASTLCWRTYIDKKSLSCKMWICGWDVGISTQPSIILLNMRLSCIKRFEMTSMSITSQHSVVGYWTVYPNIAWLILTRQTTLTNFYFKVSLFAVEKATSWDEKRLGKKGNIRIYT